MNKSLILVAAAFLGLTACDSTLDNMAANNQVENNMVENSMVEEDPMQENAMEQTNQVRNDIEIP